MTNRARENAWAAGEWSSAALHDGVPRMSAALVDNDAELISSGARLDDDVAAPQDWAAGEWSTAAVIEQPPRVLPMLEQIGGAPLRMMARMPARRAPRATAQLPEPRRAVSSHRMSMIARTDDERAPAGEWAYLAEPLS